MEVSAGDKENASGGGEKGGGGGADGALFSADRFALLLQSLHRAVLQPLATAQSIDTGAAGELAKLSECLVGCSLVRRRWRVVMVG